jgi:hypothetical protein
MDNRASCPECGSYAVTVTLQPDPDDEDNFCEYRCDDCGHYFVAEAPPNKPVEPTGQPTLKTRYITRPRL